MIPLAGPRRLSDASRPGGAGQPQSDIHQGRYLRGQTQMEGTAKVVGAEAGGEKLEEQTQTRVRTGHVGVGKPIEIRTRVGLRSVRRVSKLWKTNGLSVFATHTPSRRIDTTM